MQVEKIEKLQIVTPQTLGSEWCSAEFKRTRSVDLNTALRVNSPSVAARFHPANTLVLSDVISTLVKTTTPAPGDENFPALLNAQLKSYLKQGGDLILPTSDTVSVIKRTLFDDFDYVGENPVALMSGAGRRVVAFQHGEIQEHSIYEGRNFSAYMRFELFDHFVAGFNSRCREQGVQPYQPESKIYERFESANGTRLEISDWAAMLSAEQFAVFPPFYLDASEAQFILGFPPSVQRDGRERVLIEHFDKFYEAHSKLDDAGDKVFYASGAAYSLFSVYDKRRGLDALFSVADGAYQALLNKNIVIIGDSANDLPMFCYDFPYVPARNIACVFVGSDQGIADEILRHPGRDLVWLKGETVSGTTKVFEKLNGR